MRILFVASNIECPGGNGGSTHVTEVVTHLRERDAVLLIARGDSSLPGTLAIGHQTPRKGLRQLSALRLALLAFPEVERFAPEVIYERGSAFGLGAMLGRMLAVPTLCMVLDEHKTRLSLRTARRLIATREDVVPAPYRHKLRLVRWGANTRTFRPDLTGSAVRARLGIPPERLVIGYTGAFYAWHGLEELVEAAKRLDPLDPLFLLVGDGERRALVQDLVRVAGRQRQFLFTGRVPYHEVPEHIAACDVCVAPYNPARHKHFGHTGDFVYDPLKLFEYMACGKPVVTLRARNIEAMFGHGRELLLVDAGDVTGLAAALRGLLEDPTARAALGAAGRVAVERRFSWAAHAKELRVLFTEMLPARGA